jgi:hypothetical protein
MSEQALVAVGGTGSRLRAGGIEVPVAKSFLEVEDRPLLHWSLQSMALGGIRRIVLTGDRDEALEAAENVVWHLPISFDEVKYHKNPGLGVHGLPYQATDLLEDEYFFEAGHNLNLPSHYRNMSLIRQTGKIVLSAFRPHISNERQPVYFSGHDVIMGKDPHDNIGWSLSHPFLINSEYAQRLTDLNYSINSILEYHSNNHLLQWVHSDMPPEVDTPEEYWQSLPVYANIIRSTLGLRK